MSATDTIRSSRRRSMLVMASERTSDRLPAEWRGAERADSIYDALGRLARPDVAGPIGRIAVDDAQIATCRPEAGEALRRLDPGVELVLLGTGPSARMREIAADAGFDAYVDLGETGPATAAPSPAPAAPPGAPDDASAAVGSNGVTATSEAEDDSILLGDTDLVRAILHDAEGVGPTALRLMRQHTAWHDLVIVETPPCESDGSSVVAIRSEGRTFGHLVSDQASADALRGWASWLGTWLALDDAHRDLRVKAYQDDLTGAWNRRFFDAFMAKTIAEAARQRRTLTVLVFDIDNFKTFNDSYGHEAGDEILRETVRLLNSVIRQGDRVCRIGGDEFCVVFSDPEGPREPGSCLPETAELLARRFQDQICQMKFPKLGCDAPGRLSISGGLASYPWDGRTAAELLRHADHLALASKRCGKNVITFGPGAAQLRPESREPRTDSSKTP